MCDSFRQFKEGCPCYPSWIIENPSSSSDGLFQYCLNLSWWLLHKTTAFYKVQCTDPLLFHNIKYSLSNYGFILNAIFLICMYASNTTQYRWIGDPVGGPALHCESKERSKLALWVCDFCGGWLPSQLWLGWHLLLQIYNLHGCS